VHKDGHTELTCRTTIRQPEEEKTSEESNKKKRPRMADNDQKGTSHRGGVKHDRCGLVNRQESAERAGKSRDNEGKKAANEQSEQECCGVE